MFGGKGQTEWHRFMKEHAGEGMNVSQMGALYRQQHPKMRRANVRSRCAGKRNDACTTMKNCKLNKNGVCYTTKRRGTRSHCAGMPDSDCKKTTNCKVNKNGHCYLAVRRPRRRSSSPKNRSPKRKSRTRRNVPKLEGSSYGAVCHGRNEEQCRDMKPTCNWNKRSGCIKGFGKTSVGKQKDRASMFNEMRSLKLKSRNESNVDSREARKAKEAMYEAELAAEDAETEAAMLNMQAAEAQEALDDYDSDDYDSDDDSKEDARGLDPEAQVFVPNNARGLDPEAQKLEPNNARGLNANAPAWVSNNARGLNANAPAWESNVINDARERQILRSQINSGLRRSRY